MHAPRTQTPPANCTSPTTAGPLRRKLMAVFGIDLRALAAFRIAMGVLLLVNLWSRFQDLAAHYTDDGIMPLATRFGIFQWGDQDGGRSIWSLHMLNGSAWSQVILFLVEAVFAVWLLIGYRTRLATCASWLLLVSLDGRNPMLSDGGDALWEAMLFWSLFVPLGAAFSIDRRLRPPLEPPPQRIASVGTVVMLGQVCLMYFMSAAFKMHPSWNREFTAVYYVLNLNMFTTPFGKMLLNYPDVMKALTCLTFWLELVGPFLVFVPLFNGWFRMAAVLLFAGLHLSFVATIELGMFPWICLACWLLFIPSGVWDALARIRFGREQVSACVRSVNPYINARLFRNPECPRWRLSRIAGGLAAILFAIVVLWNVRELVPAEQKNKVLPAQFNRLVRALGLAQRWSLFSPPVFRDGGWYAMEGTLRDGSKVNLWQPGEPLPTQKPELVGQTYVNQRWRNYLVTLTLKSNAFQKAYLADWLRWRWDGQFAADDPQRKVGKVRIIFYLEKTPEPGEPRPSPEETVWEWRDPQFPDPTLQELPPPVFPSEATDEK